MTEQEAVAALKALMWNPKAPAGWDNEQAHGEADAILLQCVPASVREAYEAMSERFWYG